MRRTSSTLGSILLVAASIVALSSAPPTAGAAAAAHRCAGQKATVVGTPGLRRALEGTRGPDVIVTNGQAWTRAGRGRDLVCVTGSGRQRVNAGDGSDRVLVPRTRRSGVEVFPGNGDDVVRGGAGGDSVTQSGAHGTDTISLGRGDDRVSYSTRRGAVVPGSPDRVTLGPGNDVVTSNPGAPLPFGASFDGGSGRDELTLGEPERPLDPLTDVAVDMTTGRISATQGSISVPGVEELRLFANPAARVEYVGTAGDDAFVSHPSPTSADMLGGNDELVVLGRDRDSVLVGGAGVDLLDLGAGASSITADLLAGTATVEGDDGSESYAMDGFEDLRAQVVGSVTVTGDDGPNRLVVDGCDLTVSAAGGADVVVWREVMDSTDGPCPETSPGARFDGGEGEDRLAGSDLDDALIGGPGDDVAEGGDGRDRCEAETRIDCEA